MRGFFPLLMLLFIVACSPKPAESDTELVNNFLNDVTSLEAEKKNPIESFIKGAEGKASKAISFNKSNVEAMLEVASTYKYAVITVGNHTIVKITDLKDCKASGSWGACMPFAEGYIKKGELVAQEGYINNIIGMPDEQERKLFLFE